MKAVFDEAFFGEKRQYHPNSDETVPTPCEAPAAPSGQNLANSHLWPMLGLARFRWVVGPKQKHNNSGQFGKTWFWPNLVLLKVQRWGVFGFRFPPPPSPLGAARGPQALSIQSILVAVKASPTQVSGSAGGDGGEGGGERGRGGGGDQRAPNVHV